MPTGTKLVRDFHQAGLADEWKVIHKNIEDHERNALFVKLFAVAVCLFSLSISLSVVTTILLLAILWLQEGILKTFQSRLNTYILEVESKVSNSSSTNEASNTAFTLYSHWDLSRPSNMSLIKQYITNSLKPTVMVPYVLLIFVVLIRCFS